MSKLESLKPLNRYLTIIPHVKENETNSGVLLPDDFKPEEERFIEATILDIAADCSEHIRKIKYGSMKGEEKRIIIDRTMIENISLKNKTHHVILENYVVGIFKATYED